MDKQRINQKNKLNAKEKRKRRIILIAIVSVLIIAISVTLLVNNGFDKLVRALEWIAEKTYLNNSNGDGKIYTSLLSGKANILLPEQFDTNSLLEIHFVNVGQGDAIIINLPDGKTILIDAGTSSKGLADIRKKYLQYLNDVTNDKTIDYLVVTHPDTDHYNLLEPVFDFYDIKNFYYNENQGKNYIEMVEKAKKEPNIVMFEIDSQSFVYYIEEENYTFALYACGDSAFKGAQYSNAMSVICLLSYGGRNILFTGDAEFSTEKWFISEIGNEEFDMDVVKVGHHGSKSSSSDDFLNFINAEYAIISCDNGEKYGHPDDEAMQRLSFYGIATYRTNFHGNIVLYLDGDGDFGFLVENDKSIENNTQNHDDRKIPLILR